MRTSCILGLCAVALTACVTTQERPDGSTKVRISLADALGVKPASTANAATPQAQQANGAAAPAAMAYTSIRTTSLAGLFAKHPFDGTSKTYYPKVALTIVDWSRNDCWVARAKIWWSASKPESVAPFSVCFNKQDFNFAVNSAAGLHVFMRQMALEHTGNVRSEGPKPPMLAMLDQQPMDAGRAQRTYTPFLQQVIAETGWKGGAPTNFWIVGYNAEVRAEAVESKEANVQDLKTLESALRCNPRTGLEQAMRALRISEPRSSQDFAPAPAGLKVFGLPVAAVQLSPDGDEGFYQTRFAAGVSLEQVNQAANLKPGKARGFKLPRGKGATLDAEVKNGAVVLSCTIN